MFQRFVPKIFVKDVFRRFVSKIPVQRPARKHGHLQVNRCTHVDLHVQKDFVQRFVQDLSCSMILSKRLLAKKQGRAMHRNLICCNFDSNMSSNARQILDPCSLRRSQKASLKNPWEHSSLAGTQKSRISWFKYACRPDTTHAPFDSNKF